jgi:CRP-like cAMP-binding protein/GNAT superfamily N-acetyltransferase
MTISIFEATGQAQRERIYRFRYGVHVVELGKIGPGVDHAHQKMTDACDRHATLLYAEDESGEIVGTASTWFGDTAPFPERIKKTFATQVLEEEIGVQRLSATGRLMVDPKYRGRTLTSLLVMRLYQLALERGTQVDFCMCSLPLLRLYQHLGYRPYQQSSIRPDGVNLRVPLALCVKDRNHLAQVRSPFVRVLEKSASSLASKSHYSAASLQKVYGSDRAPIIHPTADIRALWAELADGITRCEQTRPNVFDGLSDEDRKALFARSTIHQFSKGELIKLGKERRRGLGVLLRGRLGVGIPVSDGHHWVEILDAGDVFGEIKLPPKDGRVADLVSIEPCAVVLLPDNIVERLEHTNPKLAMRLASNLLAVLRQRVDDMHRLTAENISKARKNNLSEKEEPLAI